MQPHQRSAYYGASPPDQQASSAAPHPQQQPPPPQHHYRRPSSPGPYGNPPPGYSSAASSSGAGAHYSQGGPGYGRHDYKDDYYQDHHPRREYEPVEPSHDSRREYAPHMAATRDLYQSSPSSASPSTSSSRLHRPTTTREGPVAPPPSGLPPASRHGPSSASPSGYPAPPHHAAPYPTSSSARDQEHLPPSRSPPMHRASGGHPYSSSSGAAGSGSAGNASRYAARSPSPGPYGSPPGGMSYRQFYEQQQQQQQHGRPTYRPQEYYASDGEGEMSHAYHHTHAAHAHGGHPSSSRAPGYSSRSWQSTGSNEGSAHDYPATGSQQVRYRPIVFLSLCRSSSSSPLPLSFTPQHSSFSPVSFVSFY